MRIFFLKTKRVIIKKIKSKTSPSKKFIVIHKSRPVIREIQSLEDLVSYLRLIFVLIMPKTQSGMPKIEKLNERKYNTFFILLSIQFNPYQLMQKNLNVLNQNFPDGIIANRIISTLPTPYPLL